MVKTCTPHVFTQVDCNLKILTLVQKVEPDYCQIIGYTQPSVRACLERD